MSKAVYPGSFDPVTYGHLDVIVRGSKSFDEVIVGVLQNSAKSPLFSVEERVNILKEATKELPNVKICAFNGLSVNFAREHQANVILRGLRAITDFEYELQMAQTNRVLAPDVDTVFDVSRSIYERNFDKINTIYRDKKIPAELGVVIGAITESQKLIDQALESEKEGGQINMCGALEELVDKGRQEGMQKGILANIRICKNLNASKADTIKNIAKEFSLPEEIAVEYVEKYW